MRNAGYADTRKQIIEVQRNRKTRIASLLYTYQACVSRFPPVLV